MGIVVSTLRNSLCSCLNGDEKQDIETNYTTPKTSQPDIEPDTSNLDYTTDNMFDMRNLEYSTLNDHE